MTIKFENLCPVGKALSVWGLPTFMEHIKNCKQCTNKTEWKKLPSNETLPIKEKQSNKKSTE